MGKEFDFLRSYKMSSQPLPFYYSPGDFKVLPLRIHVDDSKYEDSSIRLAIASETPAQGVFSPKIEVTFEFGKDMKKELIRLDGGGITASIEQGKYIHLKPLSALQPREAATYRLLISWAGENFTSDESQKTFAVPIVFYERLSWFSALSILAAEVSTFLFFLGLCWALISCVWAGLRSKSRGLQSQIKPN